MIVLVEVERVTLDTSSDRFVVILRDTTYKRWLPIVIGPAEAQAIALQLEDVSPPRPMTHDLFKNLIEEVGVQVAKVVINNLQDNTYFANIDFRTGSSQHQLDARPSDAIALALRVKAPIFVEEEVMKKASISDDLQSVEPPVDEEEIKTLNLDLQRAVREERFEEAARIRDQINELLDKIGRKPPFEDSGTE